MDKFAIFTGLLGGLGLFLYGMKLMGDGLENAAGEGLKSILEKLTSNKYIGVLVGAAVTAIIQSSSATTVMIVSFVNAGLMNLLQAAGVIMGANIGTTITAQMVSFKLDAIAPIFIGVGAIILLVAKKKRVRDIASIALGFGILFMGMGVMSDAMKPIAEASWFKEFVIVVADNSILGLLAGLGMTAVVQSSSATTGILVALATTGAIDMRLAFPVILGCNIGTCVTAILASLGANRTAKKAALIHLLFNSMGALIFLPFIGPFIRLVESTDPSSVARQVANAHTIFNVTVTVLLLPLSAYLVKIVNRILPGDAEIEKEGAIYLDKSLLETPIVANGQVFKETLRMATKAKENVALAMEAFTNSNMDSADKVYKNEKIINALEKDITDYLVELSQLELPEEDIKLFSSTYHVINDIERIGDHAENIADLAVEKINKNIHLGSSAKEELTIIFDKTMKAMEIAIESYNNKKIMAPIEIEQIEDEIDELEKKFRENNIKRLNEKSCSAASSVIFLDLLSNLERIGDHANNIGTSGKKNK
ncbi:MULTISPECIES: Na/Pi cotransporter family protein [Clostridium]|uniref:Na/Pi-cotransporter family protein/PhoU family protein n=1 Tax=Clostridium sartagoforme AAU1 TaxID=1202534 RepID=R9CH66_9CLOT|nr:MULTISPECIES: Na/Pi cotransporter family protein [Clostridium]EOR26546.1 Na/Pi-cotransporter family protein/PhoU family protein [Clostridium sartagoforme AAU1]KLE17469.1 sodium-dependent phosphate transporter [Clostridium sp. C8]